MKSSEVRRLLRVTERTLTNYNNRGILHPVKINEKHYEYDEKEVYSLVNKNIDSRKNVTYARVSLRKQKDDLLRQNERLYDFCVSNGIELAEQLEDIKSGMNFNERKSFIRLVTMVVNHEIDTVVIENKDRLVRFGFDLVDELFKQHGTKIIVMSQPPLS